MDFMVFLIIVGLGIGAYLWLTKMGGMEKVDQKAKELVDAVKTKLDDKKDTPPAPISEPEKIGTVVLTKPSREEEEEEKEVVVTEEDWKQKFINSPIRPAFFSPMSPEEVAILEAWDKAHPK